MVNKCVALGCNTGYVSSREKVSMFSFPRNKPKVLQKWINFVNRANWIPSNNSVLCSKHFEDKFIFKGKRNKLDWSIDPIPTVGVHFGKARRRSASLSPIKTEFTKTPQHHNIERKRVQDVFPIDSIKDCCCKTSPCSHSGKGNDCSPTSLDSKASEEIKNVLVIANHRQLIMTKLSSLWRKKQLCDAGISNGTSTVKVHKVVLSAVCPTLISTFGTGTLSKDYIQVNFPKEVSMEALNAFAEYMYNGILDLNYNILKQLKIIANKLDMKEFEQLCHSRLLKKSANAAKRPFVQMAESTPMISLLNTIHESPVSMDSGPSVTTPVVNTNQESTQHELRQVKMETDHMFGQESEAASLAQNKSGNSAGVAIYPSVKIESVEPKDNKYGHLSSRSHQVLTSANSTSSSASTSISSVPTSSTEFSIPFSQSTYCKRIKLKPMHSYETPLVSDVSPVSCVGEPVCSPSIPMKEESSKQLSRHSLPTSSLQPQSTSTNNQVMYPEASFTASADNQSFMRFTNVIANTPQSQSSKPLNRQSTSTSSVDISSTTTDNAGIYPVALFMAGGDSVSLLTPNAESIGE